jgi:hypothetical protein
VSEGFFGLGGKELLILLAGGVLLVAVVAVALFFMASLQPRETDLTRSTWR